jgi:hypothetical protein
MFKLLIISITDLGGGPARKVSPPNLFLKKVVYKVIVFGVLLYKFCGDGPTILFFKKPRLAC